MRKFKKGLGYILLTLFAFVWIYPVLLIFISSFKTPEEILKKSPIAFPEHLFFGNYINAWETAKMGTLFTNSFVVLFLSLIFIIITASLASYALAKIEFRGKGFVFIFFLSGIMIPIQATIISLFYVLKKIHLVNTHIGLVFVYTAIGLPMSIYILTNYMKTIPDELEESAKIDGCTRLRFFTAIMLPLIKPATATVMIIQSLNVWNDLLLQMLLITSSAKKTITAGLMYFAGQYAMQWDLILAGVTIISTPLIIIYIFMQKNIITGLSSGALKE